ncbi:MAG: 4-deoxy-L-threo-5-hexosulose-uronateketol-isomer [Bacteroidetes bacterium]|uniref:5-dehydro-4-deoxy-D-glucuronate isomerase n=1 Tax=unclassified Chitinophaga TaxID=2619133 RepID=UPI0009C4ED3E|nr:MULTISPECIES: 5-dehydro-4-deoxy-D-glucuronate isomerase [unclassified Chitinophaga]MBP1651405.1 4-deoxy-L-threo-5-hexosulose-uronateketol-isomer [Bacteroidota bacterium]OMP75399.1 5-dehydro-4-deoxy-D-glucuronate isomerase [[Flexibacter] sp. ATCC 35208]WPV67250.1 5-dehydro-4-deoxy-D-glucuronate isomerase [Chitinophaga sp. LS1]
MTAETRYATSPASVLRWTTDETRKELLIDKLFFADDAVLVYSHYDRFITGGIMPVNKTVKLGTPDQLKATYFLERRELGIINVGAPGKVQVDGEIFEVGFKEALYIGRGKQEILFSSNDCEQPAKYYINSTPAHQTYPTRLVTKKDAEIVTLGSPETANHRTINKLLVASVLPTCQLQMGMTELKTGSIWNTIPAHTHDRRMEVYFYFEVPDGQSVCHFWGQPQETRHIWMQNEQAVISPPWSIHSGAGTSNYTFIWGMAGENLDYGDMDVCAVPDLR